MVLTAQEVGGQEQPATQSLPAGRFPWLDNAFTMLASTESGHMESSHEHAGF